MKPFNADGSFQPSAVGSELRFLAIRGAGASVLSQGIAFAVQTIATMVLARILTPADFGVVTMVTTFSLLLVSFGLNGFTELILQRDRVDLTLASNLFWINLGASLLLAVGFASTGSLLARFYGNPHVRLVAVGMSATIFLSGTSVLHLALLKRAMEFTALSVNGIIATVLSVTVSILLGLGGWGYWALVVGNITLQTSISMGAWILCRWTPSLPRRLADTRSAMRFALNVYSHFIVSYFTSNLDNLLVGWRFNAQNLGVLQESLRSIRASRHAAPVARWGGRSRHVKSFDQGRR